ncbi:DUF29 domain-containing protein [uncultured Sphingomonas sp.]|uniref:DUF29 domain-containing protein n=1 Tax=uncultured Sphingomonas sp. TaxID=158754 RepID=UPI0035CAA11D
MADRDPQIGTRNRHTADSDFAAWIYDQVAALREGRFSDLDIDDLTDEVESLAKRDFKKLRSYIQVILTHMLKWDWQPERRDVSWRKSINASRERVWGELASSPSFRPRIAEAVEQAYPSARLKAWDETGVFKLEREPVICPYSWDEIMSRPHELDPDDVPQDENDPLQGDISFEDD